jgi:hypothetical protein
MSKSQYSITPTDIDLKSLASKERKDQLLQYNLDTNLVIRKWRFTGADPKTTTDFDDLLNELFATQSFLDICKISGAPSSSMQVDSVQVKLTTMSMDFFATLENSGALSH